MKKTDFTFGWWTTGRDLAAIDLFNEVYRAVENGTIPGGIAYCFSSREPGESDTSDQLIKRVESCGIPVFSLSAARFEPELRSADRLSWRHEYHHRVLGLLSGQRVDVVVLAGYMWVVSPEVCSTLAVINLHPAAPGGPAGTWQEVIWQLLKNNASETGVMMHLVTPELDRGPAVTCCTFAIKGPGWDELWSGFREQAAKVGMDGVMEKYGEEQPLFKAIRKEGVKRELSLIVHTLRSFATGDISIRGGRLYDRRGKAMDRPYDLTTQIEKEMD